MNSSVTSYSPSIYYRKTLFYLNKGLEFDYCFVFLDISDIPDENFIGEDDKGNIFDIREKAKENSTKEKIEAAIVDGANRFQRLRFIIIPHIMPLIVFVSLIHLMDAYRVFDEIIGFDAAAHRISLQWLTYDFLMMDQGGNRFIGRASATSILTMIGIIIILIPVLRKTWKDQKERKI